MKRFLSLLFCLVLIIPAAAMGVEQSWYVENGSAVEEELRVYIDFAVADYVSEDIAGWIYEPGTFWNFPVMAGTKDDYYRNHTYGRRQLKTYGPFYLPANASRDFSETNIVLLGRVSSDGAGGQLKLFDDSAAFETHPCARLLTRDGDYQLDYFAFYSSADQPNEAFYPPKNETDFSAWLEKILKDCTSCVSREDALPAFGERIAVIAGESKGRRKVLLAVMRPIQYVTEESYDLSKYELDLREGTSHAAEVGPLGEMYVYLQKDPVWSELRFESVLVNKYRHISGGGCGPCAFANIIINLIDIDELPKLMEDNANGLGTLMCACSANRLYCSTLHLPYHPVTSLEYARYLPVILCNYMCGNNRAEVISRWKYGSGTTSSYIPYVCETLGLECIPTESLEQGLQMMMDDGNAGFLFCAALDSSPFSVVGGTHYVTIAGVDEEGYAYVLDSLNREKFKGKVDAVNGVGPGVGRFRISNMNASSLCPEYYIRLKEGTPARQEVFRGWAPFAPEEE